MKLSNVEKMIIRERRDYKARRLRAFRKLRSLADRDIKFTEFFWEMSAC